MSTAPPPLDRSHPPPPGVNPDINRILAFFFDASKPMSRWFTKSETLDREIEGNFMTMILAAPLGPLDHWSNHPEGTLALLILLDQFPRNVHRGTPQAFETDAKALRITTHAIVQGFDKKVPLLQQPFFYLPLVHSETLLSQIAAKAIFEGYAGRCENDDELKGFARMGIQSCQQHMDVIEKFGRFPARNQALGRESTPEEVEFLRANPGGMVPLRTEGEVKQ